MTAQSRATLKSYFQRGLRPTQAQYGDLIDSFALVSADAQYLPITGGIMTGAIQLPGVPTSALAAATKGYVDAVVSAGGAVIGGSNGQVQYNNAGVLGGFTVSGDAASLATNGVLTLANTAVSAGTYVLPTLTVDSKGRVTSATAGSSTAIITVKSQIFTASGTYTPSAGMLYCVVEVVGGGGSGTGGSTTNGGNGGGAGGYSRRTITAATIGASQAVTVGAGGAPGTGGTSSLGALLSATGGAAGAAAAAGASSAAGGSGSGGDYNIAGGRGNASGSLGSGGSGGNSFFGGGGGGGGGNSGGAGAAGTDGAVNTGGGGAGGGYGTSSGGTNGGSGVVIITEFCSQ